MKHKERELIMQNLGSGLLELWERDDYILSDSTIDKSVELLNAAIDSGLIFEETAWVFESTKHYVQSVKGITVKAFNNFLAEKGHVQ